LKICKIFSIFSVLYLSIVCETVLPQSRFEIVVSAGYSRPLLEAYGKNVKLDSAGRYVYVDGKRLVVSDNLGVDVGYSVQSYLKYDFLRSGHIKGLVNIGYNILYSVLEGPTDNYGVRIQTFSLGAGIEANPLGNRRFYPSVFGLMRLNFVGGESYYHAGLDFFKVTARYGYSAGININYLLNKKIGLMMGYSYTYDNLWNKQTEEVNVSDPQGLTISLRDKASQSNGLKHDRRIAYWTLSAGIKFNLK
jgi:hypothetical protein